MLGPPLRRAPSHTAHQALRPSAQHITAYLCARACILARTSLRAHILACAHPRARILRDSGPYPSYPIHQVTLHGNQLSHGTLSAAKEVCAARVRHDQVPHAVHSEIESLEPAEPALALTSAQLGVDRIYDDRVSAPGPAPSEPPSPLTTFYPLRPSEPAAHAPLPLAWPVCANPTTHERAADAPQRQRRAVYLGVSALDGAVFAGSATCHDPALIPL